MTTYNIFWEGSTDFRAGNLPVALQGAFLDIPCMKKFVDVALPVAVDQIFTYLLPPGLQDSASVGMRAIVPFGRTYATGLIVDFPADSPLTSLKHIRDIVDPTPVVSDELLGLCRWIAEYYFAPLGEVLKAAIPHGFAATSTLVVRALPVLTSGKIEELGKRSPKRKALLQMVLERREVLSSELQRRTGITSMNPILRELARDAYIAVEQYLPRPSTRPRLREVLLLQESDGRGIEEALRTTPMRKKRVAKLLSHILTLQKEGRPEIPLTDLLKSTGASASLLKEYRASGLLHVVMEERSREQDYGTEEQTLSIVLNDSQQQTLRRITDAIDGAKHRTFLLHGVTGSGKTQVYIEAIRHSLLQNKSAIVLVPEISLTPQIVRRFKSHFADQVGVVHSRMSPGERHDVWRSALRGTCRIVIGPRSAIFAPLQEIGLIVVDEEHEASYKQYDTAPRYNARDVAIVRGANNNAVVVLGSATPSVESYANAGSGKYELLTMPRRIDNVPMPDITIVDMNVERKRAYAELKETLAEHQRKQLREFQQPSVSALLHDKIADRLARSEGIILLQNRRGFAPFVECPDCGYSEMCENCNVTLTYHLTQKHLRCHYCGLVRQPYLICPKCGGMNTSLRGIGTQRVEEDLARLFPEARLLRMDLDTTSRKGAHDRLLRKFGEKQADILLGTQMVAKGLDFPHVTLVGVISADTQMLLPDFRSSERTFQLLTQVAGRAGRSTLHGEVVIQTNQPKHYTLEHVIDHNFLAFYEQELRARQELDYPPFSRLGLVEIKGEVLDEVRDQAERFGKLLKKGGGPFALLGPAPAVIEKLNKLYRWHIILKDPKTKDPSGAQLRYALATALRAFEPHRRASVRLSIDIDPVGLM